MSHHLNAEIGSSLNPAILCVAAVRMWVVSIRTFFSTSLACLEQFLQLLIDTLIYVTIFTSNGIKKFLIAYNISALNST